MTGRQPRPEASDPAATDGDAAPAQRAGRRPLPPQLRDTLARAVMAATRYVEIRAGKRPASHLEDWVSDAVARQLRGLVRRRRGRPSTTPALAVRRVVVDRQERVTNVVVVLDDGTRPRPVAVALTVGPDPQVITIGLPEDQSTRPVDPPAALADAGHLPHPEALPRPGTPPTRLVPARPAPAPRRVADETRGGALVSRGTS